MSRKRRTSLDLPQTKYCYVLDDSSWRNGAKMHGEPFGVLVNTLVSTSTSSDYKNLVLHMHPKRVSGIASSNGCTIACVLPTKLSFSATQDNVAKTGFGVAVVGGTVVSASPVLQVPTDAVVAAIGNTPVFYTASDVALIPHRIRRIEGISVDDGGRIIVVSCTIVLDSSDGNDIDIHISGSQAVIENTGLSIGSNTVPPGTAIPLTAIGRYTEHYTYRKQGYPFVKKNAGALAVEPCVPGDENKVINTVLYSNPSGYIRRHRSLTASIRTSGVDARGFVHYEEVTQGYIIVQKDDSSAPATEVELLRGAFAYTGYSYYEYIDSIAGMTGIWYMPLRCALAVSVVDVVIQTANGSEIISVPRVHYYTWSANATAPDISATGTPYSLFVDMDIAIDMSSVTLYSSGDAIYGGAQMPPTTAPASYSTVASYGQHASDVGAWLTNAVFSKTQVGISTALSLRTDVTSLVVGAALHTAYPDKVGGISGIAASGVDGAGFLRFNNYITTQDTGTYHYPFDPQHILDLLVTHTTPTIAPMSPTYVPPLDPLYPWLWELFPSAKQAVTLNNNHNITLPPLSTSGVYLHAMYAGKGAVGYFTPKPDPGDNLYTPVIVDDISASPIAEIDTSEWIVFDRYYTIDTHEISIDLVSSNGYIVGATPNGSVVQQPQSDSGVDYNGQLTFNTTGSV